MSYLYTNSTPSCLKLNNKILYEPHRKNVKLDLCEEHKMEALNFNQFVEDFIEFELIFEFFKIKKREIDQHPLFLIIFLIFDIIYCSSLQDLQILYD